MGFKYNRLDPTGGADQEGDEMAQPNAKTDLFLTAEGKVVTKAGKAGKGVYRLLVRKGRPIPAGYKAPASKARKGAEDK